MVCPRLGMSPKFGTFLKIGQRASVSFAFQRVPDVNYIGLLQTMANPRYLPDFIGFGKGCCEWEIDRLLAGFSLGMALRTVLFSGSRMPIFGVPIAKDSTRFL